MLEEKNRSTLQLDFINSWDGNHVQTTNIPYATQTNLIAIEADWSIH